MEVTKAVKTMMINHDIKHIDIANKIGYTKQGFSNLLKKDNYKINDLVTIANACDYDVEIHLIDKNGINNITIK